MSLTVSREQMVPGETVPSLHRQGAAETVAARALTQYLRGVARRGKLACRDGFARPLGAVEAAAALTAERPGNRPMLVVYWGADALAVALLPFLEPGFLASVRALTFLFDETFGGHVCAALIKSLRSRYVMLERSGRPERLEQLCSVVRRGGSYAFAVDGGGPYFEVGTGVATLARALRAFIVPIAVTASPALPVPHRSRISFPLPHCRTTLAIGTPIDGLQADRRCVVAEVQAALVALGGVTRCPPDQGERPTISDR